MTRGAAQSVDRGTSHCTLPGWMLLPYSALTSASAPENQTHAEFLFLLAFQQALLAKIWLTDFKEATLCEDLGRVDNK